MKIKELNQHCGECDLIEYCGNAFGYCICTDSRFQNLEVLDYLKLAECSKINLFAPCTNCNQICEMCEFEEDAREFEVRQIADFVESEVKK